MSVPIPLGDVLTRIRASHAEAPPVTPEAPTANRQDARALFAAFDPALQAAMKTAAHRERWSPEEWVFQTTTAADLFAAAGYSPAFLVDLAALYRAESLRSADHG